MKAGREVNGIISLDIVEVSGRKLEDIKILGFIPPAVDALAAFNIYIRWTDTGVIRADRSDTDETIVSEVIRGGKIATLARLMLALANHYGCPVKFFRDYGVSGGQSGALLKIGTVYPTPKATAEFSETFEPKRPVHIPAENGRAVCGAKLAVDYGTLNSDVGVLEAVPGAADQVVKDAGAAADVEHPNGGAAWSDAFWANARRIARERANAVRRDDLFNRALWVGYGNADAWEMADCFDVPAYSVDACDIHPGHVKDIKVEGCEACGVIAASADYTPEGMAAREREQQALIARIAARDLFVDHCEALLINAGVESGFAGDLIVKIYGQVTTELRKLRARAEGHAQFFELFDAKISEHMPTV